MLKTITGISVYGKHICVIYFLNECSSKIVYEKDIYFDKKMLLLLIPYV